MKRKNVLNNIKLVPVYIVFLPIWAFAGLGKFFGPGVPPQFVEMFSKTFIGKFPGATVAFYQIALLETTAAALFLISLLCREFLQNKAKPFLNWAMFVSLLNFSVLGFGLRVANSNDLATQLFFYFGATAVIWMYVQKGDQ